MNGCGFGPASDRPLPARRLIARTVMSWSQRIWHDRRTPVALFRGQRGRLGLGDASPARPSMNSTRQVVQRARPPQRVQLIDAGVLLEREHQALVERDFERTNIFNGQLA